MDRGAKYWVTNLSQRIDPMLLQEIYWGSPPGCSYLRNAYYVITFCCFTQVFVGSAYKELTMTLSPAPNLLRPNNLSGDLTDDCVNNFMSFFE